MSLFDHNVGSSYSRTFGGALYGESVTVDRSTFIHNTAMIQDRFGTGSGGAIRGSNVTVEKSVFSHNTAHSRGGAIYTLQNSSVVSCWFVNNTANSFGGALYVAGAKRSVSVTSSFFINNTAIREGGGAIYSNGRFTSVTLVSSTFNYNSAPYCSVLDLYHFRVDFTNNLFTYNTATGQNFGGGVACIRNASVNILNSVFKHNFANYHGGVFYIEDSITTVDGSIFINNSAALDGGVFYTYIHASDYIITRSQFSDNVAGDDGGVMLIGWLNCFVSIDESIFDFNSAADRGGVIALISSSVNTKIKRTNIFNNTAQFGEVISACNSQVTFVEDILTATVDPVLSSCTLYGGHIRDFNITIPDPEIVMTTASSTMTELPTKAEKLATTETPATTEPPITNISLTINEEINQNHTRGQSTEQTQNGENLVVTDAGITATSIAIAAISLVVSLASIIMILIFVIRPRFQCCLCKNERNKSKASQNVASEGDELTVTDQVCSLPAYSSPVFDPLDDDSINLIN